MNEEGISLNKPLENVAGDYIKGRFLLDVLTWMPLGLLSYKVEILKILWLIKCLRMKYLKYYFGEKFLMFFVNFIITFWQGNSLYDEKKKRDMIEDHIFITEKIYLRQVMKLLQLIFKIMYIVYFVGLYFFILVESGQQFIIMHWEGYRYKQIEIFTVHPDDAQK